jgi:hypothetical protein
MLLTNLPPPAFPFRSEARAVLFQKPKALSAARVFSGDS